ncbi:MAG: cofactor-independent phosphoglycerate mutase [Dehalococcoidales bacterium]|nr:cofactor-independent phosphoglycerate mutase [Dehalococcoidales bacterium]
MKYCVLIIDGAADWPVKEQGGQTCLEASVTPNLDKLSKKSVMGLTQTVPAGMEPSSAVACMSVLGYDPQVYYRGRAAIEAVSMGVNIEDGEVIFRCNLVNVQGGKMNSYCAGHISDEEAAKLIDALNESLGNENIRFYPGVGYRHLLKLKGYDEVTKAICTPAHDISDKLIADYLPNGKGSSFLRRLMQDSVAVLENHKVNTDRRAWNELPANMIWLFWGSGKIPQMPPFRKIHGKSAAITSAVDLLKGLGKMMDMDIIEIPGVTDNLDNDFIAQVNGGLKALDTHDLVVIHIEAPDEAGHAGSFSDKVEAIQIIDREVVSRIISYPNDELRVVVMPDHPTPVAIKTHVAEPVPFLLWGQGFAANGARRFTEAEAKRTGLFIENGYNIMTTLVE